VVVLRLPACYKITSIQNYCLITVTLALAEPALFVAVRTNIVVCVIVTVFDPATPGSPIPGSIDNEVTVPLIFQDNVTGVLEEVTELGDAMKLFITGADIPEESTVIVTDAVVVFIPLIAVIV
jgi:hypothetical protein